MRTLTSLILVLLGTFCLYQFSVRTTLPQEISSTIDYKARPALSDLGANYPINGLLAAGALWGIGLGLFLALSTAPRFEGTEGGLYRKTRRPGMVSRIFLLNGALAGTMIDLAYVGAVYAPAGAGESVTRYIGLFYGAAALQLAVGILLFILALCEKQKGKWSLSLGSIIYIAALASWIMTYLWGNQG